MDDADRYVIGVKTEVAVARVRSQVAARHADLVSRGLLVSTAGAVSERVPHADLFVIRPAGIPGDDLAPENMVLCELDGTVVSATPGGNRAASTDAALHAAAYRALPDVNAIVHAQSGYAAAWAARGEEIPCVTVSAAEMFGGPVPVAPIGGGDDDLVRSVLAVLGESRSPAVLIAGHGAFTVGTSGPAAQATATLLEDVARTTHLAQQAGSVPSLPQQLIDRRHDAFRRATSPTTDDRR
ncbi:class II aldolase/adducin family protein [Microbacterium sp. 179-B 1A2 NHS]|uniref:class II aldolase/adducin family protein n=1 Tax=Microbacterium sp. 179-B 1A2 NHS TaxID=3142383 RepID=UPI0039A0EA1B